MKIIPLLATLSTLVSAYPHAPGTCNLELMHTIGHGPSQSTCDDCYSVHIEQSDSSSPMDITITGRRPYQGILVQVKNTNNVTVGEFVDYAEDLYFPVVCEDEDVAVERPEGWAGSIGHTDAKLKTWPVQLRWSSATQDVIDSPSTQLRVQGMVVLDYDNYHILPEMPFTVRKPKALTSLSSSTPSPTTTTTIIQPDPTDTFTTSPLAQATLIDSQPVERDEESTTFFLQVLCFIISMYFMMALLRRRLRRGSNTTTTTTTTDPEAGHIH